MVMASGIGLRPTSGRSNSRPENKPPSNSTPVVCLSDTPSESQSAVLNTPAVPSNNIAPDTLIPSIETPVLSTELDESTFSIDNG